MAAAELDALMLRREKAGRFVRAVAGEAALGEDGAGVEGVAHPLRQPRLGLGHGGRLLHAAPGEHQRR